MLITRRAALRALGRVALGVAGLLGWPARHWGRVEAGRAAGRAGAGAAVETSAGATVGSTGGATVTSTAVLGRVRVGPIVLRTRPLDAEAIGEGSDLAG